MVNVNSDYKATSDVFLSYDRLVRMKADLEELQRVDVLDTNVTDEQIAIVSAWILDLRVGQLKCLFHRVPLCITS